MTASRSAFGVVLLVLALSLAVLGILLHYAFTAEYGDITSSGLVGASTAFLQSPSPIVLVMVVGASVGAAILSRQRWVRIAAVAVSMGMVLGVVAVTPAAIADKRAAQFSPAPQCLTGFEVSAGDGGDRGKNGGNDMWIAAARESQSAFDSIEHVGLFGGGGGVGVGGCRQGLTPVDGTDFMDHYRSALPQAGWLVVADDGDRIRAENAGMAFEVRTCTSGGAVWAGRATETASGLCPEG